LVLGVVLAASQIPASGGLDVSFGADVEVGNDARLFLSISSRYFDRDVRAVEDYARRYYPNPDDLSVALFLSSYCDRSPEWFFSMRKEGLGWFEIGNRCRVPVDIWFVPVDHDPGPPYGKAYGYWKKHRKNPGTRVVLSDTDCRNLVAVRIAHEYYGVPVATAMEWRASGQSVDRVLAGEYRKRHVKARERDDDDGHPGKGRGKGKGKNKRGN